MSYFGQRLKEERERCELTTRELARLSSVSQPRIVQIENNPKANPSVKTATALARPLGVSPEYLMRGGKRQGAMFVRAWELNGQKDVSLYQVVLVPTAAMRKIAPGEIRLPIAENDFVNIDNPVAVSAAMITSLGLDPGRLLAITAEDDGIDRIRKGDTLIVDLSDTRPADSNVYVIAYGEQRLVRRVFIQPDGKIILSTDTERYPSHTVDAKAIRVIGRVAIFQGSL